MTLNEEIVLGCAFRYALGRMTYVVDSVASEIERNIGILPSRDLERFVREIDEAIEKNGAGMQMDVDRWKKCRLLCREQLNRIRPS